MEIKLKEITVQQLVDDYADDGEDGVVGFGGKLNIRPKYQREYVYEGPQRNAVIDTLVKGFPLNVMYWADNGNGSYEVIDGQQRILSICKYYANQFSVKRGDDPFYFHNLTSKEKKQILDYRLMVYFCRGNEREKLAWFETINIAGLVVTKQELRNAVYSGEWVTDAKRYFSKHNCAAQDIGGKYVNGAAIRQEILETAIRWASKGDIEGYMSKRQHDESAEPLWEYFEEVIRWVVATFPKYRKEMKGLAWGSLHRAHKDDNLDPDALEARVAVLMEDEEVDKKSGIYQYVLTGAEKHLHLRRFTDKQKRIAYERQGGKCVKAKCGHKEGDLETMHGDHRIPWSKGGKTTQDNCQMLCAECNREKSDK